MRHPARIMCLAALATGFAGCGAQRDIEAQNRIDRAVIAARDMVYPATVRVDVHRSEYVGGSRKRRAGNGSGVIFDAEGHVLTNYHVAGRADEISVILFNKERVQAELVGGDPWTDLAVLKLDIEEVAAKGVELKWARFGGSNGIREGEGVLAIGSPFGLSRSISRGIISCADRVLGTGLELPGGLETGLFNTWLQTDAAINPGNSGGPLVNFRGEVIGINTRGGGNDLGFAVPIDVVEEVARSILEKGKVTRSTIGVTLQPLQDLERFFEVGKAEGAVVGSVDPDGPAAAAGIQAQDVLLAYGDMEVSARYPEDLFELRRRIARTPVGATVPVRLKRGSTELTVELTTDELTTVRSEEENFEAWGLVGQTITGRRARREDLASTEGVYVTGVRSGEPADEAGVKVGDVVVRMGEKPARDLDDLVAYYKASVEARDEMVLLRVMRGRSRVLALMEVSYEEADEDVERNDAAEEPGEDS